MCTTWDFLYTRSCHLQTEVHLFLLVKSVCLLLFSCLTAPAGTLSNVTGEQRGPASSSTPGPGVGVGPWPPSASWRCGSGPLHVTVAGPFHFWFVVSYREGCWVLLNALHVPIEISWFLSFTHTVYYINWFSDVKTIVCSWEESRVLMVYDPFACCWMRLASILWRSLSSS